MHWETLELDPATATAKDVKRSYAKRLKTCRPDQDPEGFRLLHEAYTGALAELQWRESPGGSPSVPAVLEVVAEDSSSTQAAWFPDQPVAAPEPVKLSPGLAAVVDVMDRLESALKSGSGGVAALVREAEAVLVAHPAEVERWGELLHDLIRNHGKHEDLRLKPEAILFELERNGLAATVAVIDRLDRQGIPRGIRGLSELFSGNRKRIATPAGGIACARLAGVAAFWAPGAVEELANLAYENLARGERDFHMQMIDHHAGMRGFLAMVPDALRSFLRQRLMDAGGSEVWDCEEGAAVLRWLGTPQAKAGPVYEVIRKLLPESVAGAAGLPPLEDDSGVVTISSSSSASKRRVVRPAPPRRSLLSKPGEELDWEENDELSDVPDRAPEREPVPIREAPAQPAGGAGKVASPRPVRERANWLDLENDPSRGSRGRESHADSGGGGSPRSFVGAVFVVAVLLKVIWLIMRASSGGD